VNEICCLSYSTLKVVPRQIGAHSEWFWGLEFKEAYNYLFPNWEGNPLGISTVFLAEVAVYPNPFVSSVSFNLPENQVYSIQYFELTRQKAF
jgi:hypothetical protein